MARRKKPTIGNWRFKFQPITEAIVRDLTPKYDSIALVILAMSLEVWLKTQGKSSI